MPISILRCVLRRHSAGGTALEPRVVLHFPPPHHSNLPLIQPSSTYISYLPLILMMGLLSGLQGGASNVRKRVSGGGGDQDRAPEGSNPDDTSVLWVT
jgi:hypothetical protein